MMCWISLRITATQACSVCEHCSNDGKRGSLEETLLRVHSKITDPCLIVAVGQVVRMYHNMTLCIDSSQIRVQHYESCACVQRCAELCVPVRESANE